MTYETMTDAFRDFHPKRQDWCVKARIGPSVDGERHHHSKSSMRYPGQWQYCLDNRNADIHVCVQQLSA